MAAMLDDPEQLLLGVPIGLADIPDGEPPCQLRALVADTDGCGRTSEKRTFAGVRVRALMAAGSLQDKTRLHIG